MRSRDYRGTPQTCFSIEPVEVCRGRCETFGIRYELVPFHCLPANDASAKNLERKLRRNNVLSNMEGKTVDMRDYVNTQEECRQS